MLKCFKNLKHCLEIGMVSFLHFKLKKSFYSQVTAPVMTNIFLSEAFASFYKNDVKKNKIQKNVALQESIVPSQYRNHFLKFGVFYFLHSRGTRNARAN